MAKSSRAAAQPTVENGRISPDPLAAVLPALAALGTVASIAAVNWAAADAAGPRARSRHKAGAALRDLESNCLGLQDIFRRLSRTYIDANREGATAAMPVKFGVHGRCITQAEFQLHQQLVNDIASSIVLASQNSYDVMCSVEDGEIDAPETLFFGFGEQQERLNQLLAQRPSLRTTIEAGFEIAVALAGLVEQLKRYRREPARD